MSRLKTIPALPKFLFALSNLFCKQYEKDWGGGGSPIRRNKGGASKSNRRESVGVLDATWGCQRDGLDVAGEHLHGCRASKQIKRDELPLGGLVLVLWRRLKATRASGTVHM